MTLFSDERHTLMDTLGEGHYALMDSVRVKDIPSEGHYSLIDSIRVKDIL